MKMRRVVIAVLAISFSIFANLSGNAHEKPKASAKSTSDTQFKRIIDQYYAAWSTLSTDTPASFYAKEPDLVFYDIAPFKYTGWTEYKAGVQKNFFDSSVSAKLTPNDDLKVERRGNIAWTTVSFHLSAKLKTGGSIDIDARHTAIWEKRGAKWLIVHEHISAPIPN